jgi:energy-coupling factor transport system permease protein
MQNLAPLTKLLFTFFVTVWAIFLQSVPALSILIACQLLLLLVSRVSAAVYKGIVSLLLFAVLLAGLQYVMNNNDLVFAMITALKMIAMTLVFFLLLATTRMQDLSAALVSQCRVPYEYAFMITAALRFIPDFLNESKAIQDAQACRGYSPRGNPLNRLMSYAAILKPLVLKAVGRSETMALSLELRGFSNRKACSFKNRVALSVRDYAVLSALFALTFFLMTSGYS